MGVSLQKGQKVDLTKKISKEEYKAKMPQMEIELGRLQRECRELKIPVMIVFEGFGASGKGVQIGKLIQSMDPRGFQVFPIKAETEDERMHPFLWRFWTKTPEAGRIAIFDGSWYRKVLIDRFEKRTREKEIETAFHSIEAFEKQLTDGGTILVKLLLDIDQKEQKKRLSALLLRRFQILAGKWLENPSTTKIPWPFVGNFQAKIVVNGQGVRRQIIRSNLKASAIFMLKQEKSPGRVIIMILKNWMKS